MNDTLALVRDLSEATDLLTSPNKAHPLHSIYDENSNQRLTTIHWH